MMPSTFILVNAAINGVISLTATLANGMIVYTFASRKSIRSINNIFLVQLAFVDMLKAGIILSVKAYNQIKDTKSLDVKICLALGALYTISTLMDVLLLTAIALVRFYKLIKWQAYERVFTYKRAILYSVLIQSTTLIISTFPILGIGRYSFSRYHGMCFADWSPQNIVFRSVFYFFIVAVSFTVISYCYVRLILVLRTYKKRLEGDKRVVKQICGSNNAVGPTPALKAKPNGTPGTIVPIELDDGNAPADTVYEVRQFNGTALPEQNCARQSKEMPNRPFEGNSLQPSLHEIHVTKVMLATVIAYAVCWLPMFILTLMKLADAFQGHDYVIYMSLTLVALNTLVNPLIYGVWDNRFRGAMKALLLGRSSVRNRQDIRPRQSNQ